VSIGKFIFICIASLTLNLIGSAIGKFFALPIYLDTSGTIFIAALGGYVPGIAVGFFTNLLKAIFESTEMYYCTISILIAIVTAFLVPKKIFNIPCKILILITLLTFLTGIFDLLIENFLKSADFLKVMSEFELNFETNFKYELLDKSLSVFLAYFLFRMTPLRTKREFLLFGRSQAPLSDEMKRAMNEKNYLSSSLRTKVLLILMLSSLLISFSIALISYLLFKDTATTDRIKGVDGMVTVVLSMIDPAKVDNYIKYGRNAEGYKEIEEKLYAIKNSSTDVKYLYVYRITEEGCRVVFDLNTAYLEADKAGEIAEFDPSLLPYRDDLIAGKPIQPIISDDKYGYLLTLYKPLYDVNGKCQCYAAIDFSMDTLREYMRIFIIKLLALFAGCFIFIFAVGLAFVENSIILPVNTMAYCARNFSYDSDVSRKENIKRIRSLRIKTGDEIENLYIALIRTTENLLNYLKYLQRAKGQVADMQVKYLAMDEIAHKDSMTGVKNKTAYNEAIALLNQKILLKDANFCIVMVDVNYLKRVNDNYGHERGNEYLINACKLTCGVFGKENVYRIGGDEFVVIIEGEKVSLCKYFVAQFKSEMEHKTTNLTLNPWEKVSAAVGMATYEPSSDKNSDEVFKRADKEMYENKLAMKANRTD